VEIGFEFISIATNGRAAPAILCGEEEGGDGDGDAHPPQMRNERFQWPSPAHAGAVRCRNANASKAALALWFGKSQDQLCSQWKEMLDELRLGGEKSASKGTAAISFIPCAEAMLDRILRKIKSDGGDGQEVEDVCSDILKAFADELSTYGKLGFTTRMRFMAMDDFLYLQDIDGRTRLGLLHYDCANFDLIDCISFSGGGAKGIGFVPLCAMISSNDYYDLISKDYSIAGTSVGAMTAAMCAFGVKDVEKATLELMSGKSRLGSDSWMEVAYPTMMKALGAGIYDCMHPVALIDRYTSESVRQFLAKLDLARATKHLSEKEIERISILMEPYDTSKNREEHMLRFSDIALLRNLPGGKRKFHDLAIAIFDVDGNGTVYASAHETPNYQIAYGVRDSISMPILMKRPSITRGDGALPHRHYDGGLEQNLPDPGKAFPSRNFKRKVFVVLDSDGEAYAAYVKNGHPQRNSATIDFMGIKLRTKFSSRSKKDIELCRSGDLIIMPHATVKSTEFGLSEKMFAAAEHQAAMAARRKFEEMRNGYANSSAIAT
jgi:predicted acylesterase/phospholipase RssA